MASDGQDKFKKALEKLKGKNVNKYKAFIGSPNAVWNAMYNKSGTSFSEYNGDEHIQAAKNFIINMLGKAKDNHSSFISGLPTSMSVEDRGNLTKPFIESAIEKLNEE